MSALLKKEDHQLIQYAHIVDAALAMGWEVILLPHVRRPGNDDSERLAKLAVGYDDRVSLVSNSLTPAEVFELTSRAEFVVTGRMHLAILATLSGAPAVTLGSQGKVDGLYASLGKDSWAIDPASDFGKYVAEIAREVSRGIGVVDRDSVANLTELAALPFRSQYAPS
jgi:polysaccharide pyruvyl transferase WcaK-like protein